MNKKFIGYFWAFYSYQKTEKARHDIKDYLRALGVILLISFIIWRILVNWHLFFTV